VDGELTPGWHSDLAVQPWGARRHARQQTARGERAECAWRSFHVTMVLVQLVMIIGTFSLPAFKRVVTGSLPALLSQAGIDFEKHVSLLHLPGLVAQGGGLDYLMAGTFTIFIVIAPVLRSLTLLALLVVPMKPTTARWLHINSKRIVAYTALDVMIIATPLIGVAFGPMSEVLVNGDSIPLCKTLDYMYDTGEICMRIDVYPMVGYWFNVGAIVMMLLSGFDGSPTSKFIHRRLIPYDHNPPPSCDCNR